MTCEHSLFLYDLVEIQGRAEIFLLNALLVESANSPKISHAQILKATWPTVHVLEKPACSVLHTDLALGNCEIHPKFSPESKL